MRRHAPSAPNGVGRRAEILGPLLVLAVFAVVKLADPGATAEPLRTFDTPVFARAAQAPFPSLAFFTAAKPFTAPLIFRLAGGDPDTLVRIHQGLSILGWGALAWVVAGLFEPLPVRLLTLAALCGFALTHPVSAWDRMLQSEASSLSLFSALLALTLLLWRRARRGARCGGIVVAWLGVALLFGGTRDTSNYTLLGVAALLAGALPFLRAPRAPLALATAGLLLVIGCHELAARTSKRWHAPLLNVLLARVVPHEQVRQLWLQRYDLPENPAFFSLQRRRAFQRGAGQRSVKETVLQPRIDRPWEAAVYRDVRHWFLTKGRSSYQHYLLTHPVRAAQSAGRAYLRFLDFRGDDLRRVPASGWSQRLTRILYPRLTPGRLLAALLATAATLAVALRRAPTYRLPCALVAALLANSALQMFVAYHGDVHDLGRHSLHYGISLRLALLVTGVLAVALAVRAWPHGRIRLLPRRRLPTSLCTMLLMLGASRADGELLYGVDFGVSELYTIDLATGAATLVAPTGVVSPAGIAFDDDGTLYAVDVDFGTVTLFVIHPATGATSEVGPTGVTAGEGGLVFDPGDGLLYSKANPISGGGPAVELITIDPATGVATVVGNMGLATLESDPSGFALLPGDALLAFDPQSGLPDRMLSIDQATGLASEIGPTGTPPGTSVGGVALDPETGLYYASDGVQLLTIDATTGAASAIGPHGETISGLSFGPEEHCMLGTDDTSVLHDVSADDGSGNNARPTAVDFLGGIALSPSGNLYATRTSGNSFLYELDIALGTATAVGALGLEQKEGGLDFDPVSGVLYGVNGDADSELFTVDTTTGAGTLIGPVHDAFGDPIDASALAFDPAGDLWVLKTNGAPELYRLDPADATVLEMVPIPGFPPVAEAGMEFDDASGDLYVSMGGQLLRVDPTTGGATVLGPTPATSSLEVVAACGTPPAALPALPGPGRAALLLTLAAAGALAAAARRSRAA